jgi:Predicted membrane protein, hemolysin III homolog
MRKIAVGGNVIEVEHEGKTYKIVNYSKPEETLNAVTHGVGAVLFLIGLIFLLTQCTRTVDVFSSLLLCIPAVAVYGVSAIYHSIFDVAKKDIWRKIDHSNIPFIVMGSSAPLCLSLSTHVYNYIGLGLSFAFAVASVVMNVKDVDKYKVPTMIINFIIGVLLFFVFYTNRVLCPQPAKYYYLAGVILCVAGSIIYGIKLKFMHGIFHIFELIGTFGFYVAALYIFGIL